MYLPVAFFGVYLYGSSVERDIFRNVAEGDITWQSYVLRFAFLIVLAAHIPFIFFAGKECFLMIIDEMIRKSVSTSLR